MRLAAARDRLRPVFARYSLAPAGRPNSLVVELEQRGLFRRLGERRCGPEPWTPTVEQYLACRHSQRGFSRTHMGPGAAAAFDRELRQVLNELRADGAIERRAGRLRLSVSATVVWGRPLIPPAASDIP